MNRGKAVARMEETMELEELLKNDLFAQRMQKIIQEVTEEVISARNAWLERESDFELNGKLYQEYSQAVNYKHGLVNALVEYVKILREKEDGKGINEDSSPVSELR